ncbi:SDR family oxidoreductase [Asticcacaulis sp. YBE204]|uniref:SDR family oxidoreductase n=1 Tax=Asticcacaulis sp. YBE204 TaxID=1282363 RepID=UPI0003C3FCEF|nr:SDR family oxidoreductase [Asticcacaulis sp. YBE204]ESQ77341.1 nucleoside-diphosphate sugar epimerase [Asticcacaulis sp. YBE204]
MSTLLVTGASGQLGQLVLKAFDSTTHTIIAGSRDPSKLGTAFATRTVDFDAPDTLTEAFQGVDRLLLISTDALAVPGQRLKQHTAAIEAAKAAGVKHIVYTSLPNAEPGNKITFAPDHYGTEQALKASGIAHTILRNDWYIENLLMSLPHALETGSFYTSAPEGRVAYVAREDAARAAAAALSDAPEGTFTITGPEALTYGEVVALASQLTGKPVAVVAVTDEQYNGGLQQAGLPGFVADMLTSAEAAIRAGQLDGVTDSVQTLTGQAPKTVKAVLSSLLK